MNIIKKIMFWDKDLTTKQNIMLILYRVFEFLVPSGIVLWSFLIEKLVENKVSITAKIGCAGIVVFVIMVLIAVYFLKKHFRNKITKLTNKVLECLDNEEKKKLIIEKRKVEKWQEIFHNACFVAPFIIALLVVNLLETQMLSLRGVLFGVVSSMCVGFGFNVILQNLKTKIKE